MAGGFSRRLWPFILMLTWLAGIGTSEASAAPPPSTFTWGPCPEAVPAEQAAQVRCGLLTVPENRATGSARTIALPVAVVPSRSTTPQPDPLVFPTTGGPGAGSLSSLWYWLDYAEWARAERDIILVEQRGDHLASPYLDCPETGIAHRVAEGRIAPLRPGEFDVEGLKQCYDRLRADGVDLSAYTSAATAADLADLRRALGYDRWNLYGVSYGSRVSLTTMRDQPAGLRAVILDGVFPPNGQQHRNAAGFAAAVRVLFAGCAAQASCAAHYPDLEGSLVRVLDRVRTTPIVAEVHVPGVADPVRLEIGESEVLDGLFSALYDDDTTRALPFVIDRLAQGDDQVAAPLAQRQVDWADYHTEGLWRSIDCAEELPFYRPDEPASDPLASRYAAVNPVTPWCSIWTVPALAPIEDAPVRSDIPTLLMNGGHDPVTPPWQGRTAAETLSRHYLFEFGSSGHGTVWQNWISPCPADIARQFLTDPTRRPDAACMASMTPASFLTTDDIHPTPAIYRLTDDLVRRPDTAQIALLGACGATFAVGFLAGIVALIRRRRERWEAAATLAASGVALGYAGTLFAVLRSSDALVLGFGVPAAVRPLLLAVGSLMALATLMVIGVAARSWVRRSCSVPLRVLVSVVAGASLLFTGYLLVRGMLFL